VLCADEKPCIQALDWAQGWIRLPTLKRLLALRHEYKRHGTSALFAAFQVATGLVHAGHYRRRRRREFLSRGALQGASFTSVKMLIEAIQTFIANWNQHATPLRVD
jgi:hypothetical protein